MRSPRWPLGLVLAGWLLLLAGLHGLQQAPLTRQAAPPTCTPLAAWPTATPRPTLVPLRYTLLPARPDPTATPVYVYRALEGELAMTEAEAVRWLARAGQE